MRKTCADCGRKHVAKNCSRCYQKGLREADRTRRGPGMCCWYNCPRLAEAGRAQCAEHLARTASYAAKRADAFAHRGLCRLCGRSPSAGASMCARHLRMIREGNALLFKIRIAQGKCRQCGQTDFRTLEGRVLCAEHRQVRVNGKQMAAWKVREMGAGK